MSPVTTFSLSEQVFRPVVTVMSPFVNGKKVHVGNKLVYEVPTCKFCMEVSNVENLKVLSLSTRKLVHPQEVSGTKGTR